MIFTNKLQFQLPQHYKCSGAGRSAGSSGQGAETAYRKTGDGITPNATYNGKEIIAPKAPYSKNFGFDVTVYGTVLDDEHLANEVGDVMYYLEFNSIAVTQQSDGAVNFSDKDKGMNDYLREGGPGQYSYQVEDKYVDRKKSGEGKDIKNNPYPLPQKDKAKK